MLESILQNPDLKEYLAEYKEGQPLFLEGDDSQDLYILVSGKVEVLKGRQKITEYTEEGSVFGEMSFLLGEKRTATLKAANAVTAIRIPREKVPGFLREFPEVVNIFSRFLAKRLKETSQIVFGMREICDQLPDAVTISDRNGMILSWNRAAEKLYGRDANTIYRAPSEEMYENPSQYRAFIEDVLSKSSVTEEILPVKHPAEGLRYVSTSATALYDAHRNLQGMLSIGRDVTRIKALERRYRRIKQWFVPLLIVAGLLFFGLFWGYPYLSKGYKALDAQKTALRERVAVDYRNLKSLLIAPLDAGDRKAVQNVLSDCVNMQKGIRVPYKEILVLDRDKKVFEAVSMDPLSPPEVILGASYTGITFKRSEGSPYVLLTVYRSAKGKPMGRKDTEMAFELKKETGETVGWLLFKMDMDRLQETYNVDEDDLRHFHFEG